VTRHGGDPLPASTWTTLRVGDRVAVVTPASPTSATALQRGLDSLRQWGLVPVVGSNLSVGDSMLAGSDAARADDLMHAFLDPEVAAVFCADGGYGSMRVLDLLDWDALAQVGPTPVIGFSDNTALLVNLWARLGWESIHGPHVAGALAEPLVHPEAVESLRRILFGPAGESRMVARHTTHPEASCSGAVLVGNLTMLAAVLPVLPPPEFSLILAVEDVNEAPYRVDRCLVQLHRSTR